ncbi:MAG: autorepressor SdpR family transcription factor [Chloroflexaceae bacterium]|jgi:DNA-binding transcriptional ArsR family regulator|nr:autorepressor SdpR family transcription factor [Chloroflexaceae bacterium]
MDNALTKTMQALADPTRRAILDMLNNGDLSAGEIAARFPISAPSISHHLNVLKGAELVSSRREGQNIIYSLNATVVQEVMQQLMQLFRVGERTSGGQAMKDESDA